MRFSLMRLQEKNMIYRFRRIGASIFQIIPHIGHHQQIIVNITAMMRLRIGTQRIMKLGAGCGI